MHIHYGVKIVLTVPYLSIPEAVYGGLDLHGMAPDVKWTTLASEANAGDTTLQLTDAVDWSEGDEVMLTTTDPNPWHTEIFSLTSVSGTSVTLNAPVQYKHLGEGVSVSLLLPTHF